MFILITSTLLGLPLQRRQMCSGSSSMCGSSNGGSSRADTSDQSRGTSSPDINGFIGIIMVIAFILFAILLWLGFAKSPRRVWRNYLDGRRSTTSKTPDVEQGVTVKQIDWDEFVVDSRGRDGTLPLGATSVVAPEVLKPQKVARSGRTAPNTNFSVNERP